jgi:hypothetical protein
MLYCLSHASNPFCSGYFGDRVSFFAQVDLDCFMLPAVVGMTDIHLVDTH